MAKKVTKPKSISLFDFLKNLTEKKVPWESYSETEKKAFSPFMVQRFLSMNIDTIELVNYLQKHTLTELKPREVYKLYLDVLPKQRMYFKYVKGKTADKYNPDLLTLLSTHYLISKSEATEYLDILHQINPVEIVDIITKYGKDTKEIKTLMKINKK